jgi:RNA 3'-terminal phosphate cyclase (ATP)
MSALTQQAVEINEVRSATRYPGLDAEDMALIAALAEVTGAETSPIEPGSMNLTFKPKHAAKGFDGVVGNVEGKFGRKPNALILLNSLHSVLIHAGVFSSLVAEGETFGNNTLSYDGFAESTLEAYKKLGCYAYPSLREGAYGRESSGEIGLEIEPSYVEGIDWAERGELLEVTARVTYSNLSEAIPQRAASHLSTLGQQSKTKIQIEMRKVPAATPGCHVTVCARFERGFGSGSMMGTRGVRVEAVATSAFEQLFDYLQSKAAVDSYLADQILLPCVFANAPATFSVSNISRRLLTAIWVIKQFMPMHITVSGAEGSPGLVTIRRG